jgi:hypothetical protein
MKYRVLPYTLKVWLTSVAVAPVLQIIVQLITRIPYKFDSVRDVVVYLLICGWLFSIPCWFLLWLSAWLTNQFTANIRFIKITLTLAGVLIALLPFVSYAGDSLPHYTNPDFIWVMFYPITIAAGIWVYKLKPIVQSVDTHQEEVPFNPEEPIIT